MVRSAPFRLPRLRPPVFRSPPAPRRSARRRARIAVLWLPLGAVVCLVLAWAVAERVSPGMFDPDYHLRLRQLRAAVADRPGHPLAVVVGSSRTALGFAPETLPPGGPTVWFNCSHIGFGPVMNRLTLSRLFRDGVRPAVAVVEVMPPFYVREDVRFMAGHLTAAELGEVRPYTPFGEIDLNFVRFRAERVKDLKKVPDPLAGNIPPLPLGGHPALDAAVTPEARARRTAFQVLTYGATARDMRLRIGADAALRDTVRLCRDHGVRLVLVLTPEGPTFRGLYDPAKLARFEAYIRELCRAEGVPLIDARDWLTEAEFCDSHHPLLPGAVRFTERLVREAATAAGL